MPRNESNIAADTAKKKVTRKANPEETTVLGPEFPVESDEALADKTLNNVANADECLAHGYRLLADSDELDPFDNERNFNWVRPKFVGDINELKDDCSYNEKMPSPGYGPKWKSIMRDQDGEDYGRDTVKQGDAKDDKSGR